MSDRRKNGPEAKNVLLTKDCGTYVVVMAKLGSVFETIVLHKSSGTYSGRKTFDRTADAINDVLRRAKEIR